LEGKSACQSKVRAFVLTLEDIRRGTEFLAGKLEKLHTEGYKIVIIDAENDEDLECISTAIRYSDLRILPSGSAGLISVMQNKCMDNRYNKKIERVPVINAKAVLVISGSPAKNTKQQIEYAEQRGSVVMKLDSNCSMNPDNIMEKVTGFFLQGRNVIIDGSGEGKAEISRKYSGDKKRLEYDSILIQEALSGILERVTKKVLLSGLLIIGGNTSVNIFRKFHAKGILITGEVEPFIPAGVIMGGRLAGMLLVTKAGGFGTEDVIIKTIKYLKEG
jgi:D-threonate/D-erythronate kinase